MVEQTDVIVIGLGPGGEHVAGALAQAGLDVVGIESGLGGDHPDLAAVGVRLVRGAGRLDGPRRVAVGRSTFQARRGVVLATGSRPRITEISGLAATPYWTHRDAVAAEQAPASLLVLGGGVDGVETAQMFACLGCEVTVIEAGRRLLAGEEPEAGDLAAAALRADGVSVLTGARVRQVDHGADGFAVLVQGEPEVFRGERLLVATVRTVELAGLGLDTVGLDPAALAVPTDGRMRAGAGLWSVGAVTGRGAFAHLSVYQAQIAVGDILGRTVADADYRALPRIIFTDPEIAAVGVTERQAREQGLHVRTGLVPVGPSTGGWIHGPGGDGFVKLVEDADRGVLVGATTAGAVGGEVLYGLQVAVHAEVPVARLRQMIYAYPAFLRAVEPALQALRGPVDG